MNEPDEIIHQSVRLRIVSSLNARRTVDGMEFKLLRSLLSITGGNLASHIAALEKAGYVTVLKDYVGKKPRTRITLTRQGRRAFERHVTFLKNIIEDGDAGEV